MRRTRPLLALFAAAACLLLLAPLAGCGGGDDDDGAASTTAGDRTATTAGDTTSTGGGSGGDESGGDQSVRPDPAEPLELGVGDKVSLVLESNPTTGYSWQITVADESVARVASDNYLPPAGDTTRMGASGKQAVEIEGVGPGETTVEAVYLRPFEPDSPAQTETWTVEVDG